jgi:hypothetical protein
VTTNVRHRRSKKQRVAALRVSAPPVFARRLRLATSANRRDRLSQPAPSNCTRRAIGRRRWDPALRLGDPVIYMRASRFSAAVAAVLALRTHVLRGFCAVVPAFPACPREMGNSFPWLRRLSERSGAAQTL